MYLLLIGMWLAFYAGFGLGIHAFVLFRFAVGFGASVQVRVRSAVGRSVGRSDGRPSVWLGFVRRIGLWLVGLWVGL